MPVRSSVPPSARDSAHLLSMAGSVLLVAGAVFVACVFGILSRPIGQLASFWPANAVLLGLMLRLPRTGPLHWLGAALAYFVADALSGSAVDRNIVLNAANLVGVATGYLLFSRLAPGDVQLQRPESVLRMLVVAAAASAACGLVGAVIYPVYFGGTALDGWKFWCATELVNYIAILPLILTWPSRLSLPAAAAGGWRRLLPLLALLVGALGGYLIGGPGAVTYPVPALLWCALTYPLFVMAVLTLAYSAWALLSIELGVLSAMPGIEGWDALMSLRLGITLVAVGPLIVASVSRARSQLLGQMRDMAMRDQLTGALNRRAFYQQAEAPLRAAGRVALLMIDIDHFKAINDSRGHIVGDRILRLFADAAADILPPGVALARIGGEEFAVLLDGADRDMAENVADRLRASIEAQRLRLDDGDEVAATVSIGLVAAEVAPAAIEPLLAAADTALYRAKHAGRNRVETVTLEAPPRRRRVA